MVVADVEADGASADEADKEEAAAVDESVPDRIGNTSTSAVFAGIEELGT